MKQLLDASKVVASLKSANTATLVGQNFINETAAAILTTPMSYALLNNIVTRASNVNDAGVASWANEQLATINENAASFELNMLCESAKYDGTMYAGFKNTASTLLQANEADVVRQIAIDGVLNNYSMVPEVYKLIVKCKNIIANQAKNALNKGASKLNSNVACFDTAMSFQLNATTYILSTVHGFDIIIDVVNNSVSAASQSTALALYDSNYGNFQYADFMNSANMLRELYNTVYDKELSMFAFSLFGMKITWCSSTGILTMDGKETSLDSINAVVKAKAALKTHSRAQKDIDAFEYANKMLSLFNTVYLLKDYISTLDTAALVHDSATYLVFCADSNNVLATNPYKYYVVSKNAGFTTVNVLTSFKELIAVMRTEDVRTFISETFAKECAAESAVSAALAASKQKTLDNIAKLENQKGELIKAKVDAPESRLNDINAKILTIDDLIARNQQTLA